MTGYLYIAILSVFLTIVFRKAYDLKIRRKHSHIGDILLLIGYVTYIFASVFRKIDLGFGGDDAIYYQYAFINKASEDLFSYIATSREEFGYCILNWCVRYFTDDYRYCLFVIHTIGFVCIWIFIKNIEIRKENIISYLGTYLIASHLFLLFHLMRAEVAVCISCLFFIALEQKKYVKSVFLMILAVSFHNASIGLIFSFIPVAVCRLGKLNPKAFMRVYLACGIVMELLLMNYIIPRYFSLYAQVYDNHLGFAKGIFLSLLFLVLFIKREHYSEINYSFNEIVLMTTLIFLPLNLKYSAVYRILLLYLPMYYKTGMQLYDSNCKRIGSKIYFQNNKKLMYAFCLGWMLMEVVDAYMIGIPGSVGNFALQF
ncbi:hypothetical protein D3Z51_17565 [Clostridiaceae bacterium]|nr:hypothetical protein [Clostridiaceae bacterium]RKI09963.1 hypothetical protein D7V81_16700 [bacterium 1XD21-70]